MERIPVPKGVNTETENLLNNMMDSSLGNPIVLSSAPTTSGGELKENNVGFYSGNLYITVEGTTYRISLTAV